MRARRPSASARRPDHRDSGRGAPRAGAAGAGFGRDGWRGFRCRRRSCRLDRGRILFIASGNPRNCKGLTDFVRLAWPRIRRRVLTPSSWSAGVGVAVAGRPGARLTVAGAVDDVAPLYREAALVINLVVAGTGAKIKTIEALCHLRPIVTRPSGIDGLDPGWLPDALSRTTGTSFPTRSSTP